MATKDYSSKQEKMIANFLNWKLVSGSGARDFHKGDVVSEEWLGECKTHVTVRDKIEFKKDHWDKIVREAQESLRMPVLFVDDGSQKAENTWCMFSDLSYSIYPCMYLGIGFTIQTNLIFDRDEMQKLYDTAKRDTDQFVIFVITFNGKPERLVPLPQFIELFGDS